MRSYQEIIDLLEELKTRESIRYVTNTHSRLLQERSDAKYDVLAEILDILKTEQDEYYKYNEYQTKTGDQLWEQKN